MTIDDQLHWTFALGMAFGVGVMKIVDAVDRLDKWNCRRGEAWGDYQHLIAEFGGKLVCTETASGICKRLEEINAKHKAVRCIDVFVKDSSGKPVPVRLS